MRGRSSDVGNQLDLPLYRAWHRHIAAQHAFDPSRGGRGVEPFGQFDGRRVRLRVLGRDQRLDVAVVEPVDLHLAARVRDGFAFGAAREQCAARRRIGMLGEKPVSSRDTPDACS